MDSNKKDGGDETPDNKNPVGGGAARGAKKTVHLSKASKGKNIVANSSAQGGSARKVTTAELSKRAHRALVQSLANGRDSDVELADVISKRYVDHRSPGIFDENRLYRFDKDTGLYQPITKSEIVNLIYDIDGRPVTNKPDFRATPGRASSIATVINHRHVQPAFFDNAPYGITVANGFLSVRPNEIIFEEYNQAQRQRVRIDIKLDPNAACPKTEAFLLKMLGSNEAVELLFEAIGVALLGLGAKFQRAFILVGPGSNGKGVIEAIIQLLMPPGSVSAVPPSEMSRDYQRYPLVDSRLNLIGEFTDFGRGAWAALKSAIAGDPISVREVQQTGFQIRPRALHLFATNECPPPPESGYAVERRFRLMSTCTIVHERDADRNLAQNLFNAEKQGILRRAIDGARNVNHRGYYSDPDCVRLPTLAWIKRRDSIELFAKECLIRTGDPGDRIGAMEMFSACVKFANELDIPPPSSSKAVAAVLEFLGFVKAKSSTMQWIEVRFVRPQ